MSQIFLSHSSHNDNYVVALRDWLAEQGWDDVFLDTDPKRGIAPGERWEGALHKAAWRCEAVRQRPSFETDTFKPPCGIRLTPQAH